VRPERLGKFKWQDSNFQKKKRSLVKSPNLGTTPRHTVSCKVTLTLTVTFVFEAVEVVYRCYTFSVTTISNNICATIWISEKNNVQWLQEQRDCYKRWRSQTLSQDLCNVDGLHAYCNWQKYKLCLTRISCRCNTFTDNKYSVSDFSVVFANDNLHRLDTKTYWLTVSQLKCDSDSDPRQFQPVLKIIQAVQLVFIVSLWCNVGSVDRAITSRLLICGERYPRAIPLPQ
jgi:hypothetical protein